MDPDTARRGRTETTETRSVSPDRPGRNSSGVAFERELEIEVSPDVHAPQRVRAALEAEFAELGDALFAAQVIASELVTNAILHGEPPVRLEVLATATGLRLVVHDSRPDVGRATPDSHAGCASSTSSRRIGAWRRLQPASASGRKSPCRPSAQAAISRLRRGAGARPPPRRARRPRATTRAGAAQRAGAVAPRATPHARARCRRSRLHHDLHDAPSDRLRSPLCRAQTRMADKPPGQDCNRTVEHTTTD